MIRFTEFVARLKAWQVFILLMFPMFGGQFYLTSLMPAPGPSTQPPSMEDLNAFVAQTMLMTLLLVVMMLGWMLSIGFAANRRVDQGIRLNTRLAIACAIYATGYIALAQFIFPKPGMDPSEVTSMGLIVPLHLLATFGMFYTMAFAARNIVMAERRTKVSFFDYSGAFFLIWFFPIGVWFVQPRVNRVVANEAGA